MSLAMRSFPIGSVSATLLKASVTKVKIAYTEYGDIINDSLYVKALVSDDGITKAVIITVDAEYKVCSDVDQRTIEVVKKAWKNMVPVKIGVGTGYEDRI